ncbi:amidohydrolase [Hyunsoonleella sp. 2307UL5-6]|uniref:amidohydrolase n=1 Tax=Hyunsoonleella sp. 2307UL5-6 TaxID=3384768 RepID=UPI0039BD6E0E
MQDDLKIALIQSDLVWENPEQNRLNFTKKINTISHSVDVIILPEMFTSGFTMHPKDVAETMDGITVSWMKNMASKINAAITGSIVIKHGENYFNRLLFVTPTGEIMYYDKRHTFTLAGEDKVYTAGSKKIVITYKGWKICPLICYDLRFPVWARNTEGYDVLIYVANWPKPRIDAWNALLKARAIENMSYCIGVNRVGLDAENNTYNGCSAVYDVLGEKLTDLQLNQEDIQMVNLSKNHINIYRNTLKFLEDRDDFSLLK